jgi:hypothetical protein
MGKVEHAKHKSRVHEISQQDHYPDPPRAKPVQPWKIREFSLATGTLLCDPSGHTSVSAIENPAPQ